MAVVGGQAGPPTTGTATSTQNSAYMIECQTLRSETSNPDGPR